MSKKPESEDCSDASKCGKTYKVSLSKWLRFRRFLKMFDQFEDVLCELESGFDSLKMYLQEEMHYDIESEDIDESMKQLSKMMLMVKDGAVFAKNSRHPMKCDVMGHLNKAKYVEIIIEDVHDDSDSI